MRDVMFRGKAKLSIEELDELEITHENGWVFGNYIENGFFPYIVGDLADVGNDYIAHEWWVEVIPESVGQWTGLKDKNGKEIYEGDIAEHEDGEYSFVAKVVYNDWLFYLEGINPIDNYSFEDITDNCIVDAKVIGNIYQHPHLLEGATNGSS